MLNATVRPSDDSRNRMNTSVHTDAEKDTSMSIARMSFELKNLSRWNLDTNLSTISIDTISDYRKKESPMADIEDFCILGLLILKHVYTTVWFKSDRATYKNGKNNKNKEKVECRGC